MKRIGVVTSGGDAPGMNATIRAIVRVAIPKGFEVIGFERGYQGLITNSVKPLDLRSVGGIINRGGTALHTMRCPEFKTPEGLKKAVETLEKNRIDGLIVIGGEGSFRGALTLSEICDTQIVGIPATIDNDVFGTDETVGFDTAVNTAVSAIDKIRDTAISHERIFVVEVMGRTRGFLALSVGLAAGAEVIIVPEEESSLDEICRMIQEMATRGRRSSLIVVAEGVGVTKTLVESIESWTASEARLSILGYIQRGGAPTARSRLLASLFGARAVELIEEGEGGKVVGLVDGRMVYEDLEHSCNATKPLDMRLLRLARELAV